VLLQVCFSMFMPNLLRNFLVSRTALLERMQLVPSLAAEPVVWLKLQSAGCDAGYDALEHIPHAAILANALRLALSVLSFTGWL
jgi:hypothetical protein